jgi:hypothetical protein
MDKLQLQRIKLELNTNPAFDIVTVSPTFGSLLGFHVGIIDVKIPEYSIRVISSSMTSTEFCESLSEFIQNLLF